MGEGIASRAVVSRAGMRPRGLVLLALVAMGARAPLGAPSWFLELAPKGEPGPRLVIEGRVLDNHGRPVSDVLLHVYHADASGTYGHGYREARLAGTLRTNALGAYRIHTVLPGLGEGSPHIHYRLTPEDGMSRVGTLWLCRAMGAGSDTTFAHLMEVPSIDGRSDQAYVWPDTAGGFHCTWDIGEVVSAQPAPPAH